MFHKEIIVSFNCHGPREREQPHGLTKLELFYISENILQFCDFCSRRFI